MYKYTATYQDWNGKTRTEDFYFNFTQAEAIEMEMSKQGGLSATLQRIKDSEDLPTLITLFKDFVLKAYGKKSDDGRRFMKSEEISREFAETPVYSELFMRMAQDSAFAAEFMNAVAPANLENGTAAPPAVISGKA